MQSKRILIIDDEPTIQTVVEFGLKRAAGWDVLTAGSGEAGIHMAQAQQPDVILLDVMMPDMDGMAALSVLRSRPDTTHIPVILLTAAVATEALQQLEALGVSGMIAKPFNSLDLPAQIASMLHWSSQR